MNKKQIIQDELYKLDLKRSQAEIAAAAALRCAREIAEFREIDDKVRALKLQLAKFEPNSTKAADIKKQLAQLDKQGKQILKKHKFDISTLAVKHDCPKCNDTGFVDGVICDCLKHNVQQALIKQCGFNNKLNFDFSKSDEKVLADNPQLSKAYRFAHKYCENFPNNKEPNLVFYGEVGTGKTFLLECIANELMKRLNYVVFSTAYDINKTMIKAFNSPFSERDTILAPLFESDLLIIDDLGTEPLYHESTLTNLFTLINERQRNNLAMIVSTNLTPDQINERYGNRIRSRLFNQNITITIPFLGSDLRLKKKMS